MNSQEKIPPFILTIFGASGDLAKLKVFPALYALGVKKNFTKFFHFVGFARTPLSNDVFRVFFSKSVLESKKKH
ncbi:hypothetical protein HZA41_00240 [Candidatus Peregrinibacteria bacterium]|nr:hypothetical protein [Candidatus Peregrinibacteria bacterium]